MEMYKRKVKFTGIIRLLSILFMYLTMVVFVLSGVSKLADLTSFYQSLVTLPGVTDKSAYVISFAVPSLELLLALSWFMGFSRRRNSYAICALLVIFTLYLGYLYLFTETPDCSCLGVLSAYARWFERIHTALIRNIVMLIVIIVYIVMDGKAAKRSVIKGNDTMKVVVS